MMKYAQALNVVSVDVQFVSALIHILDQHASVMEMTPLAQGMLIMNNAVVSNKQLLQYYTVSAFYGNIIIISMINKGQGDCCEGRCRCTEDANGHQYRHNGTTENCACPPREVVCNLKVSG